MAVYVIALAAVVLLLALSYRALGGGEQRAQLPTVLLMSARMGLDSNVGALTSVMARLPAPPSEKTLREGRRGAAALQQHLDRLPAHDSLPPSLAMPASLLQAAGQDLAWAWRMLATPGVEANRGMCDALTALRDHAVQCAQTAASLLTPPVVEPAEGAGETGLQGGGGRPAE